MNKKHLRHHLVGGYSQKNPSVFLGNYTTFHVSDDILANMLSGEGRTQRKIIPGDCLQEEGSGVDIKSAAICLHYASNSQCLQRVGSNKPMAQTTQLGDTDHGSHSEITAQDKASGWWQVVIVTLTSCNKGKWHGWYAAETKLAKLSSPAGWWWGSSETTIHWEAHIRISELDVSVLGPLYRSMKVHRIRSPGNTA